METAQHKLAILARASSELFEDSARDLGEFLTSEIGYAFATKEDDCGFNGNGASTYGGMTGLSAKLTGLKSAVAAASGHNTFLALDGTDVANVMAGVLATAIPGAGLVHFGDWVRANDVPARRRVGQPGIDAAPGRHDQRPLSRFSGAVQRQIAEPNNQPCRQRDAVLRQPANVEPPGRTAATTILAFSADRSLDTDQILIRGVQRCDLLNHTVEVSSTLGPIAMLTGTS